MSPPRRRSPARRRPPADLSGELSFDKAPLGALLAIPLGPQPAPKAGARWSDAKFSDPVLAPPPGDVKVRIGALDLGDARIARGVEAQLKFEPNRFEVTDLALDAGGARLTGNASLRRDGASAAVSGAATIENLAVDRPAFKGKLGIALDFASTGANPAALIAGLVGQGQLTIAGGSLPRLDADALDRILARTDSADALIDETNIQHALAVELDKQPLPLPDGVVPLSLASGALRAGPVRAPGGRSASISGGYDLRSGDATAVVAFSSDKAGKFWSGPPPALTVALGGPPDAPTRRIDDASLVAGLAAQAIARESDRIAALEADIRERAYFNRRMKAETFLEQRRREIAAYEEDQQRLKYEADRRRVQDSLLKAYEDKRRAEAAAAAAAEEQTARGCGRRRGGRGKAAHRRRSGGCGRRREEASRRRSRRRKARPPPPPPKKKARRRGRGRRGGGTEARRCGRRRCCGGKAAQRGRCGLRRRNELTPPPPPRKRDEPTQSRRKQKKRADAAAAAEEKKRVEAAAIAAQRAAPSPPKSTPAVPQLPPEIDPSPGGLY